MSQPLQLYIFIFCLVTMSTFAQKEDLKTASTNPLIGNRFVGSIGVFLPAKDLTLNVNGSTVNNKIDFGKDLGFNHTDATLSLNFFWRYSKSKKWSVALEYFATDNTRIKDLTREIKWGDTSYPIGTRVSTTFKLDLYRIFFGRVLSRGEKHELIVGLGIHAMDIDTQIQALAYLGEVNFGVEKDFEVKGVSLIAPVPNVGVKYLYTPTPKWALGARLDWFSLKTGTFGGYLWNIGPSVSYQFFEHIGAAVSYRFFNTSLDVNKKLWGGGVNLLYQGPLIYLAFNF